MNAPAKPRRCLSAEWRLKISDGVRRAHAEARAGGFRRGNKAGGLLDPEIRARVVKAAVAVTRGSHGFGKMTRGRIDHQFACDWRIESPDGEIFEVKNLRQWVRENAHRFEGLPPSKMRMEDRVSSGMRAAAPGNRYGRKSWHGWCVLCVSKQEENH